MRFIILFESNIFQQIRKQHRHSPTEATPMADYYIIAGTIYQAPDLASVFNSRLVTKYLSNRIFQLFQQNVFIFSFVITNCSYQLCTICKQHLKKPVYIHVIIRTKVIHGTSAAIKFVSV